MENIRSRPDIVIERISSHKKIKETLGERTFTTINYIFFVILSLLMIYPFWHEIMVSFSSVNSAAAGGLFVLPKEFTTNTYASLFKGKTLWSGYHVSITVAILGTFFGTLLTALVAYPLSKRRLRGNKVFLFLIVFTMLFSGGMIPNYLLMKQLNLLDSIGALILPNMVSAFNVIIMKNFFSSLPESMEESARIDGANDMVIFFRIIIPLSMATVATIALFTAVVYWNDYFSTVLYITDKTKWSLQAILRYMLTNTAQAMKESGVEVVNAASVSEQTIKASSIVVATLPILIVYPFLQKYFVKGVMLGSVKG